MPLNLKAINAELAKRGFKATLAKGEGYFYFQGGDATDWLDRTVRVATLHSLSLEQWIGHYRELKAKNETLLNVQIKSKELVTRRTQRAAGHGIAGWPHGMGADLREFRCRQAGDRWQHSYYHRFRFSEHHRHY